MRTCLFLRSFPYSDNLAIEVPCWPGVVLLALILYFSEPKRFTHSLLHNLNFAPVYLIISENVKCKIFCMAIELISLWSNSLTSSKLNWSVFLNIGDINNSDFIDCFEYAITSHSSSLKNYSNFFETKCLSVF